jgi:putative acetyltransferase
MVIKLADLGNPQVVELLRIHLAGMAANSPPGHCFALDLSGLQRPDVHAVVLWDGDTALGIGALKELGPDAGEVKSMRTHPDHLRKGAAGRILSHILDLARSRGYARVHLETGTGPAFEAAITMYLATGFSEGGAFGDYVKSDFNQFFALDLD